VLFSGFPNVGKSSFINNVSRAKVDVQPYPFTTKSIFVGHMDYKYLRWQVLDTPGILDHPLQVLDECNNIEMQAITALAHIHSCVLFFLDLSPHCEHSIEKQIHLFNFLQPIFANKPIVVVASKSDLVSFDAKSKRFPRL
jgi:nucleolar GTP-binding protein